MCRAEMAERLRMLYEMHLPPALLPEEIESPVVDNRTGKLYLNIKVIVKQTVGSGSQA